MCQKLHPDAVFPTNIFPSSFISCCRTYHLFIIIILLSFHGKLEVKNKLTAFSTNATKHRGKDSGRFLLILIKEIHMKYLQPSSITSSAFRPKDYFTLKVHRESLSHTRPFFLKVSLTGPSIANRGTAGLVLLPLPLVND